MVISFRKPLPICAMPKGSFTLMVSTIFLKFIKIPWAVSGRKKVSEASSATGPIWVLNIKLNIRGFVQVFFPQVGQFFDFGKISSRNREWQFLHSVRGSAKPFVWPEASHTFRFIRILVSKPIILSFSLTIFFHQAERTKEV